MEGACNVHAINEYDAELRLRVSKFSYYRPSQQLIIAVEKRLRLCINENNWAK